MKRILVSFLLILSATVATADWKTIRPGVEYQEFSPNPPFTYHVARIRFSPDLRVVTTSEPERGATVSRFASQKDALVAINGDYFDTQMRPIGYARGACGEWASRSPEAKRKEQILAIGTDRADILESSEQGSLPDWMQQGISGWPMLVRGCRALRANELPGSDAFTRAPHPRTAVGLTSDGRTMYLVVADGMKDQTAGVTLADLAAFMQSQLGVCEAVNLDGGGSSAMAVNEKLVTKPSTGAERVVANHLAVIEAKNDRGCTTSQTGQVASVDWWNDVDEVLPGKGTMADGTYLISFPRADIAPAVNGVDIDPSLGYTTTLAIRKSGRSMIASGDLVVTRAESARVKSILRNGGLNVISSSPLPGNTNAVLVHFSGAGSPTDIAHVVRRALDATSTLKSTARSSGAPAWPAGVAGSLQSILGRTTATGNLVTFAPAAVATKYAGETLPAIFGLQTSVTFQSLGNEKAAAGGSVITTQQAASRVASRLRAGGFTVAAPHRLLRSTVPQVVVLNVFATGDPVGLATALRDATAP